MIIHTHSFQKVIGYSHLYLVKLRKTRYLLTKCLRSWCTHKLYIYDSQALKQDPTAWLKSQNSLIDVQSSKAIQLIMLNPYNPVKESKVQANIFKNEYLSQTE